MKGFNMRCRGFTLLEVMITCACVAILAAIAYPSYMTSIQKSRRAEAKSALLGASGQMERWFTERGTYATAALGTAVSTQRWQGLARCLAAHEQTRQVCRNLLRDPEPRLRNLAREVLGDSRKIIIP